MKVQINPLLYEKIKKTVKVKNRQIYPAFNLHPSLGYDWNLEVYAGNNYVNLDIFGKYLNSSKITSKEIDEEIKHIYIQMCLENNILSGILVENINDMYNIIFGVVSKLNYSDIKYYVEGYTLHKSFEDNWLLISHNFESINEWWNTLTNNAKGLNWIPSPKTRILIENLFLNNQLCVY